MQQGQMLINELIKLRDELIMNSFHTDEIMSTLELVNELLNEETWWSLFCQMHPIDENEITIMAAVAVLVDEITVIGLERMQLHEATAQILQQFKENTTQDCNYNVIKYDVQETSDEFESARFKVIEEPIPPTPKVIEVEPVKSPIVEKKPVPKLPSFTAKDSVFSTPPIRNAAKRKTSYSSEDDYETPVRSKPKKSKNAANVDRKNFDLQIRTVLKRWLDVNIKNPFPSNEEKVRLCNDTGLSPSQLNNWFINARRRYLVKLT